MKNERIMEEERKKEGRRTKEERTSNEEERDAVTNGQLSLTLEPFLRGYEMKMQQQSQ